MSSLPERTRSLRRSQGKTLEAVAFASGLSVATVQRVETGKHSPSIDTLSRLAAALDTTAAELLAAAPDGMAS